MTFYGYYYLLQTFSFVKVNISEVFLSDSSLAILERLFKRFPRVFGFVKNFSDSTNLYAAHVERIGDYFIV